MEKPISERIKSGISFFRNIKPNEWNEGKLRYLEVFLSLVEAYVNGEKVVCNDLPKNEEIPFEEAKEILTK